MSNAANITNQLLDDKIMKDGNTKMKNLKSFFKVFQSRSEGRNAVSKDFQEKREPERPQAKVGRSRASNLAPLPKEDVVSFHKDCLRNNKEVRTKLEGPRHQKWHDYQKKMKNQSI